MQSLTLIGLFLVNTVFSLFTIAVLLRFFLQWAKADFYNPLCQLLMKVTNWALMPLRKVIPGLFGVDLAALVLAYILEVINVVLIALLSGIHPTAIIAFVALIKLLMLILNLFFFAILLRAVASWFAPSSRHPLYELLIMFTEPVLRPIQRVIPALAGFDLSPLIALMVIQVLLIFLKGFLW